jgi:hypothetical protein
VYRGRRLPAARLTASDLANEAGFAAISLRSLWTEAGGAYPFEQLSLAAPDQYQWVAEKSVFGMIRA